VSHVFLLSLSVTVDLLLKCLSVVRVMRCPVTSSIKMTNNEGNLLHDSTNFISFGDNLNDIVSDVIVAINRNGNCLEVLDFFETFMPRLHKLSIFTTALKKGTIAKRF
jgi:hypothetical protein